MTGFYNSLMQSAKSPTVCRRKPSGPEHSEHRKLMLSWTAPWKSSRPSHLMRDMRQSGNAIEDCRWWDRSLGHLKKWLYSSKILKITLLDKGSRCMPSSPARDALFLLLSCSWACDPTSFKFHWKNKLAWADMCCMYQEQSIPCHHLDK